MDDIGELDEVKELATWVRKITEPSFSETALSCPTASENKCNCLHMFEIDEPIRVCPKHGYKRL